MPKPQLMVLLHPPSRLPVCRIDPFSTQPCGVIIPEPSTVAAYPLCLITFPVSISGFLLIMMYVHDDEHFAHLPKHP
ncbi:hypothetical protein RvY_12486 [Ramazzottius varieornatus]|uniref:Uncharacterized protein n=1 Tax=Ramazzottius varieornatus TaxID=947166 RepID=A0A1D1VJN7_RAMVA|nr:hypothetical protein RvY_12486 [Ramazzottius varieornatus]